MEHRQDTDELRARFTVWLETLLRRAKIDYIRHEKRRPTTISIDLIKEPSITEIDGLNSASDDFEFENERLARIFSELTTTKQRLLTMLFIEQLDPDEIARRLGCTVQHVYNLRSKTLKELRDKLK